MILSILKIATNQRNQSPADALGKVLNYVMRPEAASLTGIYGAGVSVYHTFDAMMEVKMAYGQDRLKPFYHYIFNPEDTDYIDELNFQMMVQEMAEFIHKFSGRYQVLSSVHYDHAPCLHAHFIANNIDLRTGQRLDINYEKLRLLKTGLNDILKCYNVSPIPIKYTPESLQ